MTTAMLRHFATVIGSNVDKSTRVGELPVRLCNYTDVYAGTEVRPHAGLQRASATRQEIARCHLQVGDTVITKDSEDPADIGVAAFIPQTATDFVCGYHLMIIRPHAALFPKFLYWQLRSAPTRSHLAVHARGLTRYALSPHAVKSIPLSLPLPAEQRRIADFLDDRVSRIDNILAARQRQLELLRQQQQSLITRLTTPPAGQNWVRRSFSHLAAVGGPLVDPRAEPYADLVLIAPNHVEKGTGRLRQLVSAREQGADSVKYMVRSGQLVYSKIRPAAQKATISPVDGLCSADMYPVSPRAGLVSARFLLYSMLAQPFTDLVVNNSERAAIPKINRRALGRLPLSLPSLRQQESIVAELDQAQSHRVFGESALITSVGLLAEYRYSLITAAVAGDLDVTTASTWLPV